MTKAEALHRRLTGSNHEGLLKRGPYFTKKAEALAAIAKARFRLGLLEAMDKGLKAQSPEGVYENRDRLVLRFPDQSKEPRNLAVPPRCERIVAQGGDVRPDLAGSLYRTAPEPLGPATTLVLRSKTAGGFVAPGATPKGTVVYALADGFAYGLDGGDGTPLWQVPVGLAAPFAPQAIPSRGGSLRLGLRQSLQRTPSARRPIGQVVVALEIGEPLHAPPLVLGNQVAVAAPSGKFLVLSLETGKLMGTLKLGRRLAAATPISDEQGQFFIVIGDEANIFVIADPLACALGRLQRPLRRLDPMRLPPDWAATSSSPRTTGSTPVVGASSSSTIKKGTLLPRQQIEHPGWTWETPPRRRFDPLGRRRPRRRSSLRGGRLRRTLSRSSSSPNHRRGQGLRSRLRPSTQRARTVRLLLVVRPLRPQRRQPGDPSTLDPPRRGTVSRPASSR